MLASPVTSGHVRVQKLASVSRIAEDNPEEPPPSCTSIACAMSNDLWHTRTILHHVSAARKAARAEGLSEYLHSQVSFASMDVKTRCFS